MPATIALTTIPLSTRAGLVLGMFTVEERGDTLFCGTFQPGRDYERVRPLFARFEEAVEQQALTFTDPAMAEIEKLGLVADIDGRPTAIRDLQIYADGNASFRL